MSLGSGALPASGHHSAMFTVLVWMRECRVTQVAPERPSIFTTSDLPKQSSKCPVGSHFRELTLSCRVKKGRVEWSIREGWKMIQCTFYVTMCKQQSHICRLTWVWSTSNCLSFWLCSGVHFANKPGRQTALQAAHSHRSQLRLKGSFHWSSPLRKACPHCARQHTGELEEIRGKDQSL